MPSDRAELQRNITAHAFRAFTEALAGVIPEIPMQQLSNMQEDEAARQAVRLQISWGRLAIHGFEDAMLAVNLAVTKNYCSVPEIMVGYSSDEVLSLTLDELGLLPATEH